MEQQNVHYGHAVDYALTTIKWLFTINLGALLVLIVLTGTVASKEPGLSVNTITFITYVSAYSLFFVGGLILVICSSLFGYLTQVSKLSSLDRAYRRQQVFALMLALGSLVSFIAGIMSCIYAFNELASA